MNIFAWIIFGFITGLIANTLDPNPDAGGLIGAVILGVLGALLGGFLGNLIFGITITGFNLSSFIIAVLGSLLLLFVSRAFRKV